MASFSAPLVIGSAARGRGEPGEPGSFAKLRQVGEVDDRWQVKGETGGGLGRHFS